MVHRERKRSPLVMIADHDEDERCLLKAILKLKGFTVVEAANGREAISLAAQTAPDLLLVDLWLPPTSGSAVIRQIKARARLRDLRVTAVLLGNSSNRHRRRAGSEAHLEKPVDLDRFTSLVDDLTCC
jgi:adenylate cyclase